MRYRFRRETAALQPRRNSPVFRHAYQVKLSETGETASREHSLNMAVLAAALVHWSGQFTHEGE
jgi:hypothetical protein